MAMSPSDHECTLALAALGKRMPSVGETQYRCPPEEPNLMSVVIYVEIGEISMLLGADLEQHADGRRGWAAVLSDTTLPKAKSIVFKIPHHGSETTFSPDVWNELLAKSPLAVTTPWVRGNRRLPSASDIGRLVARTPHGFISSMPIVGQSTVTRPAMVERQLREMGVRINRMEPQMGAVQFRNDGTSDWSRWTVTLHEAARPLTLADAAA